MIRVRNPRADLFRECLPMMRYLGTRFARRTRLNAEDLRLEAEGALGILLCVRWSGFDSTKSKPSTWIYSKIYWHLTDFCRREQKRDCEALPSDEEGLPDELGFFEKIWTELGEEGRVLLKLIFVESPIALRDELWEWRERRGQWRYCPRPRRNPRAIVLQYLREEQWSESYIKKAFSQLEELCQ